MRTWDGGDTTTLGFGGCSVTVKVLFGWRATWLSAIEIVVQMGLCGGVLAGMVRAYDPAEKSVEAEVGVD